MILGPGGKVSWDVQIANDESKLISNLESAEIRVHLPSVLSFADELVLDDAAAAAGATVSGTVDSNDVVFTISAPGISELGFTFSTVVRDDITEVSGHQSGSGGDEGGGDEAEIGQLLVSGASPIDHPGTTLSLPPVEATGFYSFQVGPADASSVGVIRSLAGLLKLDPAAEAVRSEAAPGDEVAYGAMVEPYAVDGSFTVVDVRFEELPDIPFALSPDLSDVSGIQIERNDDESFPLPDTISREPGVVTVRMFLPSAPTTGAGISASVSVPGIVDHFAQPGKVVANISVTGMTVDSRPLVPGDMPLAGLLGVPVENGSIPLTITPGTTPTTPPPTSTVTDDKYRANMLLTSSVGDQESGGVSGSYVPVGGSVTWSAHLDSKSDEAPSEPFRFEDVEVGIRLDPALAYNGDVSVVDDRGRPVAAVADMVDGELVIELSGAVASSLSIEFTTTVREGIDEIRRIAPSFDSDGAVLSPISRYEVKSGLPADDPGTRIALPVRAGYEWWFFFDIGPADAHSVGIYDWRGWVVGFDGEQLAETVWPGDQVMYASTGLVSTSNGGSTVVVRIEESEDAPFVLPPDLDDHSGIHVMTAQNEPVSADIQREPGVVTVTVHLPETEPSILNSSFTVLVPGVVDPGTSAAEIVPQIRVTGRNAADMPLILGAGVFGSYFPNTGIELPSLAPLPIVRD